MAGKPVGRQSKTKTDTGTQHVQSAEELFGIMSGAGLSVGVIHVKQ